MKPFVLKSMSFDSDCIVNGVFVKAGTVMAADVPDGYAAGFAAAIEQAAKVCEERMGPRGTGAWTILGAAAEAIRALPAPDSAPPPTR